MHLERTQITLNRNQDSASRSDAYTDIELQTESYRLRIGRSPAFKQEQEAFISIDGNTLTLEPVGTWSEQYEKDVLPIRVELLEEKLVSIVYLQPHGTETIVKKLTFQDASLS